LAAIAGSLSVLPRGNATSSPGPGRVRAAQGGLGGAAGRGLAFPTTARGHGCRATGRGREPIRGLRGPRCFCFAYSRSFRPKNTNGVDPGCASRVPNAFQARRRIVHQWPTGRRNPGPNRGGTGLAGVGRGGWGRRAPTRSDNTLTPYLQSDPSAWSGAASARMGVVRWAGSGGGDAPVGRAALGGRPSPERPADRTGRPLRTAAVGHPTSPYTIGGAGTRSVAVTSAVVKRSISRRRARAETGARGSSSVPGRNWGRPGRRFVSKLRGPGARFADRQNGGPGDRA